MSRAKGFSKVLKLITGLLASIIKTVAIYAPRLIKALINRISKQLRFSITFKTVTTYTFMIASFLLILSLLIGASFGGLLFYEAKLDLDRISTVTLDLLGEEDTIPKEQLKRYANIEGVTIALLNQSMEIEFSTGDVDSLPDEVLNKEGETLLSNKIYLRTGVLDSGLTKYIVVTRFFHKEIMYMLILMSALFITSIFAILVSMFKGSKNLKRTLKPIDDMIKTARNMSGKHLATRLNVVNSHDELKELAETFNEMLDRIQVAYEQQDRFVSDASHELRTPISVIQGYANLLTRWGKEDKEVLDESVTAIKNEAESMKTLVERLLFLARADKERQKINVEPFPLNELIDEVVRDTKIIDSQHEVIVKAKAFVSINADRALIKQAIRVFVDNSIKYTPPTGIIAINSYLEEQQISICIEDNGIGISEADLPYVFNRFYKCDKSRSRSSGGTGLGLAIAKWIIEKHKGNVIMKSEVDQGTKVTIHLPFTER